MRLNKLTVILRNYRLDQCVKICNALRNTSCNVEVTLNTPEAFTCIKKLTEEFSSDLKIGAGTVLTYEDAEKAIAMGASFILSPICLSTEIISLCKRRGVIVVPAAFSPTEIYKMYIEGADYIKLFPAASLDLDYIKHVSGPLNTLPIMAVGGINIENVSKFKEAGINYFGVGSAIFNGKHIDDLSEKDIEKLVKNWIKIID